MSEPSKRIAELIQQGRKIEAIKLLRDTTGLGLKQAKEEIERRSSEMSDQASPPDLSHPGSGSGLGQISKEVEDLARAGKKIEAIKLLRERTGMGLKEAKEQVEELVGSRGGCLAVVLLGLVPW